MSTIIEMPKLSDTMTVGTVVKWFKAEGDEVSNGDILAEIETDKATMELENFDDGVLLKLLAKEGDEVEIGKPLAVVGQTGEGLPEGLEDHSQKEQEPQISPIEEKGLVDSSSDPIADTDTFTLPDPPQSEDIEIPPPPQGRIFASPLAKKIASANKIDLSKVKGSGPSGRITKKDLSVITSSTHVSPDSSFAENGFSLEQKSVPISKMRNIIAKRLLESKTTIPHFYLQKEINAEPLRLAREAINRKLLNDSASKDPLKISLNDLILFASAQAIPKIPEINTSWADQEIHYHGNVNLAFGVAVDDGLVTPVIQSAQSLNLSSLANEAFSLIHKARNKKLTPDEMSGSTFTVTNLGMFGIDFFSGIINPPNAAILSVGASVKKPVLGMDGTIKVGETMTLGLSCDHRLVDGAVGARFLQILAEFLENPAALLV